MGVSDSVNKRDPQHPALATKRERKPDKKYKQVDRGYILSIYNKSRHTFKTE